MTRGADDRSNDAGRNAPREGKDDPPREGTSDAGRDAPRDAFLRAALRHAPDANVAPPPSLDARILDAARAATTTRTPAHTAPTLRERIAAALAHAWAATARPSFAGGLATIVVATVAGVLWWDRPVEEAMQRPPPSAPAREEAPATTAPQGPEEGKVTGAGPEAPSLGRNAAPAAPAPMPRAPDRAIGARPKQSQPTQPEPDAFPRSKAESGAGGARQPDLGKEPGAKSEAPAAAVAQAPEAARTQAIERERNVARGAAESQGAAATQNRDAAARAEATKDRDAAARPSNTLDTTAPRRDGALAGPAGSRAEERLAMTPPPAQDARSAPATTVAPAETAMAKRMAEQSRGSRESKLRGAAPMAQAPAPAPALAPLDARALRASIDADPQGWTWSTDASSGARPGESIRAWLARLDDAARTPSTDERMRDEARKVDAPAPRDAIPAGAPARRTELRFFRGGRLAATLRLGPASAEVVDAAGTVHRYALDPAAAAALAASLPPP